MISPESEISLPPANSQRQNALSLTQPSKQHYKQNQASTGSFGQNPPSNSYNKNQPNPNESTVHYLPPLNENPSSSTPSRSIVSSASNSPSTSFPPVAKQTAPNTPGTALKPSQVLKFYSSALTLYEHGEVLEFPSIYYYGQRTKKKIPANPALPINCGFDDENGDYLMYLHDHILFRYEVVEVLGKGSFGQCVKVIDHKTKTTCALKIIRNKKRFHKQGLVEVKLLDFIKENDPEDQFNNVRIFDSFYFRNHLCITFELLSLNLYEFMKETHFHPMSLSLIRRFAIQILNSLRYLHKLSIIHCDLKPENILLKNPLKSGIKVIDFGSSCFVNERIYSYIQSRFYRAPEVILGIPYGTGIDIWSFGCILCELLTGYPIFPGEDEVEQLAMIAEVVGAPPSQIVEISSRKKTFFDSNSNMKPVTNRDGKKRKAGSRPLPVALKCSDHDFLDFIAKCLKWNPKERITADEAIRHRWVIGTITHQKRPPEMTNKEPAQSEIDAESASPKKNVAVPPLQLSSSSPTPSKTTTDRPKPSTVRPHPPVKPNPPPANTNPVESRPRPTNYKISPPSTATVPNATSAASHEKHSPNMSAYPPSSHMNSAFFFKTPQTVRHSFVANATKGSRDKKDNWGTSAFRRSQDVGATTDRTPKTTFRASKGKPAVGKEGSLTDRGDSEKRRHGDSNSFSKGAKPTRYSQFSSSKQ
ncbi:putative DYRK-family kinase pom1 [Blattamonas nauphoetae]|uniref:dual-specificity kinase n=1 Tax=Blattamonas nauphoetae TaxID=2049346 RepID=A0ABQ9WTK5_9EUKA|nr:putative DYRK-family kinase pom1 [Blattamonas nauphoetae]